MLVGVALATLLFSGCTSSEPVVDLAKMTSQPKEFVGSETCKTCHLEHYDSWKVTNHSRMAQDVTKNADAFIVDINEKVIKADFAKLEAKGKLKMPLNEIYFPQKDEIKYTLGNEWKQRYIIEKEGVLYISPIQFNTETGRWVNYHEHDWKKRPWLLKCGGCHTTGTKLDLEDMSKSSFTEPGVGCEACHGAGSWHVALPKTALFEKRETILNPAKNASRNIGSGLRQLSQQRQVHHGQRRKLACRLHPGQGAGTILCFYFIRCRRQETYVRQRVFQGSPPAIYRLDQIRTPQGRRNLYILPFRASAWHACHALPDQGKRFKSCLNCHEQVNTNMAHSIHSFANCVGCHMPRIAKSAESQDIHSHVFKTLLPSGTLKNPEIPNSCQNCHKHKDADLAQLQKQFEALALMPAPQGKTVESVNAYK